MESDDLIRERSNPFDLQSLLGEDIMVDEAKRRNEELIVEIDHYEGERREVEEMNKAAMKVNARSLVYQEPDHLH